MSITEKLQAGDIKACYVNHRPQPGSIHVETPAATYHYTLKKPDGWETWIMNLYPCDCPPASSDWTDEDQELADNIAVGMHTGLRKGSEAPSSGPLWRAIGESTDSAWSDAAKFCVWGLKEMGYTVTREDEP
jgi:hypothetical protein